MNDLTIAALKGPSRQLAEELVRVLLADEPTGEESLAGILEYALQALVTNNVHRFSCLGKKFAGPRAEQGRPKRRVRALLPTSAIEGDHHEHGNGL